MRPNLIAAMLLARQRHEVTAKRRHYPDAPRPEEADRADVCAAKAKRERRKGKRGLPTVAEVRATLPACQPQTLAEALVMEGGDE